MSALNIQTKPLRTAIALAVVVAAGLYLRLWHIHSLFSVFHDYDPGAYSLGARFISEGYMPYRDFILVHPPLYDLVLAGIYKVFGYDFFYGRYLSVALSMVCIVLVYFIGRRMYSQRAGIVAAALFAVEPLMVYFGRRSVQEMLGLTLVLVAVMLAIRYLDRRKLSILFLSGLCLGLAVSAKYVFVPVTAGVAVALAFSEMPESLRASVARLGDLGFWAAYLCIGGAFYALLFLLNLVIGVPVSLPLIDPLFPTAADASVFLLVFVLPLFLAARVRGLQVPVRDWAVALWNWAKRPLCWVLVGGVVAGFLCVTAYFWVTMPREFLTQTVLWQQNRPSAELPSLIALARMAPLITSFFRMSCLSVLFVVPLILLLLNKRRFSAADCGIVVLLSVTVLLSQGFFQLPRYYASIFPFMLIGVSSFVPEVGTRILGVGSKIGLSMVLALFLLSTSLSAALLANYSGYDVFGPGVGSGERELYDETGSFLRQEGARKVFAVNPIFPAMASDLESSLAFDTFALLWLKQQQPEDIVNNLRREGVDHVLVDQWARRWGYPYKQEIDDLLAEIRRQGSLASLIEPDTALMVEVYRLDGPGESLVNGDFEYWSDYQGIQVPLGWNPVLISGEGDRASLEPVEIDDESWVGFHVHEDGIAGVGAEATHAGMVQRIAFPRQDILLKVMPGINTESLGATPLGPAVHFLDGDGHDLTVGFSDELEEEEVTAGDMGSSVVVRRPAPLHQWSDHRFSLTDYWRETGWPLPDEIRVLVVLSAHSDYPGYYTFHVARVETVQP